VLDQNILHYDEYKIFDKLEAELRKGALGPIGFVRIFLETKKGLVYDEGFNLVVAQGREFVAQRISATYAYSGGSRPNYTSYVVSHFGVGSGGSTVAGSTVTLNGPYICDTQQLSAISLGVSGYLTEPSGVTLAVKPVTASGGSIYLESQGYSGGGASCTNYTKVKYTCVIPSGEPTSLAAGASIKIDEAALYFVSGSTAKMFSHICFAPKWKEKESTLTILWYILC